MPNKYDIYERIFDFIVQVLQLIDNLPKNYSNQIIINQITRSVTSIGANAQEADGTNSKKDFVHCFTIVRKETKETIYWLRLIEKLNKNQPSETQTLLKEGEEILAIISSIIKNTLNHPKPS